MYALVLNLICALVCVGVVHVEAHGRLSEPPSRSSMWRYGYSTLPNYDDNQLFCGGFTYQWDIQDGKCGVCGDPWDGPWPNEAGGDYATGIIVRQYSVGADIDIGIDITANHWGWFEFRLCPINDYTQRVTHDCLDDYQLELSDGTDRFYLPDHDNKMFWVEAKLPEGLDCTQCVLQWKYHTENSWGEDDNGTECVGCGPQEEFYGCADIAIEDEYIIPDPEPNPTTPAPTEPTDSDPTTSAPTEPTDSDPTTPAPTEPTDSEPTTPAPTEPTDSDPTSPAPIEPTTTASPGGCEAVGIWTTVAGIPQWCDWNCPGNCPVTMCWCPGQPTPPGGLTPCVAAGLWADVDGMTDWCNVNCPMNCPSDMCSCPE